jgi:hypothetical protein
LDESIRDSVACAHKRTRRPSQRALMVRTYKGDEEDGAKRWEELGLWQLSYLMLEATGFMAQQVTNKRTVHFTW